MSVTATTPAPIPLSERQNQQEFTRLLAAQRQLYTEAKRIKGWTTGILTVLACIGSCFTILTDLAEGWTILITAICLLGQLCS